MTARDDGMESSKRHQDRHSLAYGQPDRRTPPHSTHAHGGGQGQLRVRGVLTIAQAWAESCDAEQRDGGRLLGSGTPPWSAGREAPGL